MKTLRFIDLQPFLTVLKQEKLYQVLLFFIVIVVLNFHLFSGFLNFYIFKEVKFFNEAILVLPCEQKLEWSKTIVRGKYIHSTPPSPQEIPEVCSFFLDKIHQTLLKCYFFLFCLVCTFFFIVIYISFFVKKDEKEAVKSNSQSSPDSFLTLILTLSLLYFYVGGGVEHFFTIAHCAGESGESSSSAIRSIPQDEIWDALPKRNSSLEGSLRARILRLEGFAFGSKAGFVLGGC